MKRIWIIVILMMVIGWVHAETPTTTTEARQQVVQSVDWLIQQVQRVGQLEASITQLTADLTKLRADNAALGTEIARLTAIETETNRLRTELATATDNLAKMKLLLGDILRYLQMPALFIQRIQAFGIQPTPLPPVE